jgi:hypothetical protein
MANARVACDIRINKATRAAGRRDSAGTRDDDASAPLVVCAEGANTEHTLRAGGHVGPEGPGVPAALVLSRRRGEANLGSMERENDCPCPLFENRIRRPRLSGREFLHH